MNGLVRLSLLVAFWVAIAYATTPRSSAQITSLPGLVSNIIFIQFYSRELTKKFRFFLHI